MFFCVGDSPATGEFSSQRLVTSCFDVFCDPRLNQQLTKQWGRRWFATPSHSLWRHSNEWFTAFECSRYDLGCHFAFFVYFVHCHHTANILRICFPYDILLLWITFTAGNISGSLALQSSLIYWRITTASPYQHSRCTALMVPELNKSASHFSSKTSTTSYTYKNTYIALLMVHAITKIITKLCW